VLAQAGADAEGFAAYAAGPGRAEHDRVRAAAEECGVFGVPMVIVDDELFWGREHLPLVRLRLSERDLARPGITPEIDVPYARR
jgi:2-hydroxychromene-2-carboxylate isomerase